MTIEDPNQLDMAFRAKDGQIVLCIADAGVTTDPTSRLNKFIEKLKTYVGYMMSDDFKKSYPGVVPSSVAIYLIYTQPPTEAMKVFSNVGPSGDRINRLHVTFLSIEEFKHVLQNKK